MLPLGYSLWGTPTSALVACICPFTAAAPFSNGCCWYTDTDGRGYFSYGGNRRAAAFGFVSGDELSAVVDSRTHSGNGNSNGLVRFLRNGKALMAEAEPLCPLGSQRRPCWWLALAMRAQAPESRALSKLLFFSLRLFFSSSRGGAHFSDCNMAYRFKAEPHSPIRIAIYSQGHTNVWKKKMRKGLVIK